MLTLDELHIQEQRLRTQMQTQYDAACEAGIIDACVQVCRVLGTNWVPYPRCHGRIYNWHHAGIRIGVSEGGCAELTVTVNDRKVCDTSIPYCLPGPWVKTVQSFLPKAQLITKHFEYTRTLARVNELRSRLGEAV